MGVSEEAETELLMEVEHADVDMAARAEWDDGLATGAAAAAAAALWAVGPPVLLLQLLLTLTRLPSEDLLSDPDPAATVLGILNRVQSLTWSRHEFSCTVIAQPAHTHTKNLSNQIVMKYHYLKNN